MTRVAPVFEVVQAADNWIDRLLRLVTPLPAVRDIDPKNATAFFGPNEKALLPPTALLSWLVRNMGIEKGGTDLPSPAGESETNQRRAKLRARDPETIKEALELLRTGELDRRWYILEGRTCPDVFIETHEALIVIEGKRTEAGPTRDTEWLKGRHQMWRHMDAAWEIRGNRPVYGFFIVEEDGEGQVPGLWRQYMGELVSPEVRATSFPHRSKTEVDAIVGGFLGATTWQRVAMEFGIADLPHYSPGYIHNSYRVNDTHVIAGEYPYDKDPEKGVERIRACLNAGVTHFIDLTRPVDGLLPYAPALEAEAARRGESIKYVKIEVEDGGVPTHDAMQAIIRELEAAQADGGTVYLHCWGGVGRTGTVVGSYLRHLGHAPDEAIARIEKLFSTVTKEKWLKHRRTTFHSEAQKEFVRNWQRAETSPH